MVSTDCYPHTPGHKGGETSRLAAEAIAGKAPTVRERVLHELDRAPATPEEIARSLGLDLLTVRPRLSELKKLGKAVDTGKRRRSRGGKMAIVWGRA